MSKFIVISSGKGGVGKTTSAVNLAAAMSYFDEDVTLVDANFSTPNVGIHLGAPVVPVSINHVLSNKAELVDAIYEHESGAKIIPASLSIKEFDGVDYNSFFKAMKELKKFSDIVIFDSAAGLGDEAKNVINIADEVIIVTNPEMPAVTDALKTAKTAQILGKEVKGVIVTRHKGSVHEMSMDSIKEMLELPILGVVPEDEKVSEALSYRNAVFTTHPNSKAAKSYLKIAANILGKEMPKKKSIFAKIFGR